MQLRFISITNYFPLEIGNALLLFRNFQTLNFKCVLEHNPDKIFDKKRDKYFYMVNLIYI